MVRKLVLVKGPFLPLKCRMLVSSVAATNLSGPGCSRICSFSLSSDGAENRNGQNKRNHGGEPQARQFNSLSDRNRRDRAGADQPHPQQGDDGRQNRRNKQTVA